MISRHGFIMGLLPLLAFLFQTEGFDLYHHTTSYAFDYPINRGHTIGDFVIIPRYLLLSDMLRFTRLAGVPSGWIILCLCIFPAYQIGASRMFNASHINPHKYLLCFVIFTLSLFYSGASLTVLWLLAYFITRKSIFLIGLVFHPIGYLLAVAVITIGRSLRLTVQICLLAVVYFAFCYFKTLYNFPENYIETPIFLKINSQNLFALFEFTILRKSKELIGFVLLVAVAALLFRKTRIQTARMPRNMYSTTIWKLIYLYSFLIILIALSVVVVGKAPLGSYLLALQVPPPVYITWFDFGAVDYEGSFSSLHFMRLQ